VGWGEVRTRGVGTTDAIERAHERLDRAGVEGGTLADRVIRLMDRLQKPLIP